MQPPAPVPAVPRATQTEQTAPASALADAVPSAAAMYEAARAHRNALGEQMESLEGSRHKLLRELEDHGGADVAGPARTGMEQRIVILDQRIAELDKNMATVDAQIARTASIPGAVVEKPDPVREGPPEEMYVIGPIVVLAVILPMSIALARRIWRRSVTTVLTMPRELNDRLFQLEQTAESTALEVERIGEGQRFMTKLLTERESPALGQGAKVNEIGLAVPLIRGA